MSVRTRVLGYPRMGEDRELKRAAEAYWAGRADQASLLETAAGLRAGAWRKQATARIDLIPSNDFSLYDHVLDTICLTGAIPERFGAPQDTADPDLYFTLARGVPPASAADRLPSTTALEMTKWMNTNYHYLVPEFTRTQTFSLNLAKPLNEFNEALAQGIHTVPVLLGPVSFLLLGKPAEAFDALDLLDRLLPIYTDLLAQLKKAGVEQVQLDEPMLATDLTPGQLRRLDEAYRKLAAVGPGILLTSYFETYGANLETVLDLPVSILHLDAVYAADELDAVLDGLRAEASLSLGVVDGRNIWKNNYAASHALIRKAIQRLGPERVILSTSCSLLHCPVTLAHETALDGAMKDWLAFADEKLTELRDLARFQSLSEPETDAAWRANAAAQASRRADARIRREAVRRRCDALTDADARRQSPFEERNRLQQDRCPFPLLPTTTIGSFPQTPEIRRTRAQYRKGEIDEEGYGQFLKDEIRRTIEKQEALGLDCLVHGEPERNDMVEYFGQQLDGFAFTRNGWVQSYGSRCVKPPIIFGDVSRPAPMTVAWSTFAQSLTERPVKGMLTGPVTILQWSFVRDDQPRADTMRQIACAIRDEVCDLEAAGIGVIQIDEPAIREGLPLRAARQARYLEEAVAAFKISTCGVRDETQIHTHMCYSEFNDMMSAIADLDADVISIEASRSNMELLNAFAQFKYPNQIGPGIWDIHSPRVPGVDEMVRLLEKAAAVIPVERLWVNPDCGLKTRGWEETLASLRNMVEAAHRLRKAH